MLNLTKAKFIAFVFTLILSIFFSFYTLHLPSYGLHQVGTAIMLIALLYFNHKFCFSNFSFILYCLFLYLHIFAACWLYSFVPYNDWFIHYVNFDLNAYFGWQRNMFDRLVHFAYGFLLYPLFFKLVSSILNLCPLIKSTSLFYYGSWQAV